MKQIYKSILALVCAVLLLFCSFSVAFAAPEIYYALPYARPTVTDYSGYVELYFEDSSSGYTFVDVISWHFTPYANTSPSTGLRSDKPNIRLVRNASQFRIGASTQTGVYGNISYVRVDTMGNHTYGYMDVPDDQGIRYFNFTWGTNIKLIGVHYYGDYTDFDFDAAGPDEEFYVTYGSETVFAYGFNQVISALYALIDATDSSAYTYQLETIINNLNSFQGSFEEFEVYYKTQMTEIIRLFNSVLDKLDTLISTSDDILGIVDNLYLLLLDFERYIFDIWFEQFNHTVELQALNQKLQKLIDILSQKSDTEFTTQDPTQFDDYYEVENSLLDNDNVNVGDVVKVEVNQNALTVIWDYVERALNSHGKVFGMVLTILALGIIALILGR